MVTGQKRPKTEADNVGFVLPQELNLVTEHTKYKTHSPAPKELDF